MSDQKAASTDGVCTVRNASLSVFPLLTSAAPTYGNIALRFEGIAATLTLREVEEPGSTPAAERGTPRAPSTESTLECELATHAHNVLACALERFGLNAHLATEVALDTEARTFAAAMSPAQRELSFAVPVSLAALLALREIAPGCAESLYLEDIEALLLASKAIHHPAQRHAVQAALYGGAFIAGSSPDFEPITVALPEGALLWVSGTLPVSRASWKRHEETNVTHKRARGQAERAAAFGARAACGDPAATLELFAAQRPYDSLLAESTGWLIAENALRHAPYDRVRVLAVGTTPELCLAHHDHTLLAEAADRVLEALAAHALSPAASGWLIDVPTPGSDIE